MDGGLEAKINEGGESTRTEPFAFCRLPHVLGRRRRLSSSPPPGLRVAAVMSKRLAAVRCAPDVADTRRTCLEGGVNGWMAMTNLVLVPVMPFAYASSLALRRHPSLLAPAMPDSAVPA